MRESNLKFTLCLLALLGISRVAQAGVLNLSELTSEQRAQVEHIAQTEIRDDLEKNIVQRAHEADQAFLDKALIGDPLTPETQAVMLKGIYLTLQTNLASKGLNLDEKTFNEKIGKILNYSSKLGVFPRAFTVGYMGRVQAGVGVSGGTQFNFYFDHGKFKVSSYSIYGAQAGVAEMMKIEFYASVCFGTCFGGDGEGLYLGLDGYAGAGVGVNFFVEGGIDLTDMVKHTFSGKPYSTKDLYKAKAIYIGAGFDIGEGIGVSGNLFYYNEDFDKVLANPGQAISPLSITNLKLY